MHLERCSACDEKLWMSVTTRSFKASSRFKLFESTKIQYLHILSYILGGGWRFHITSQKEKCGAGSINFKSCGGSWRPRNIFERAISYVSVNKRSFFEIYLNLFIVRACCDIDGKVTSHHIGVVLHKVLLFIKQYVWAKMSLKNVAERVFKNARWNSSKKLYPDTKIKECRPCLSHSREAKNVLNWSAYENAFLQIRQYIAFQGF